jgi:hypothetical protein
MPEFQNMEIIFPYSGMSASHRQGPELASFDPQRSCAVGREEIGPSNPALWVAVSGRRKIRRIRVLLKDCYFPKRAQHPLRSGTSTETGTEAAAVWSCALASQLRKLWDMERMARWVFLRLYDITLSRGFRNSPEDACNDAIVMTGMALVVPLSTSVIVLALMIPALAIHAKRSDLAAIIVALALVVPLMRWVGKRFKTYVYTPELASSYRSARERTKTLLGFVLIPIARFVAVGLGLRFIPRWL